MTPNAVLGFRNVKQDLYFWLLRPFRKNSFRDSESESRGVGESGNRRVGESRIFFSDSPTLRLSDSSFSGVPPI